MHGRIQIQDIRTAYVEVAQRIRWPTPLYKLSCTLPTGEYDWLARSVAKVLAVASRVRRVPGLLLERRLRKIHIINSDSSRAVKNQELRWILMHGSREALPGANGDKMSRRTANQRGRAWSFSHCDEQQAPALRDSVHRTLVFQKIHSGSVHSAVSAIDGDRRFCNFTRLVGRRLAACILHPGLLQC